MEDQHRQPIEASSGEMDELFHQACPSSRDEVFYNQQMQEAAKRRLPFPEALRFVIDRRHEAELMSKYRASRKRVD